MKKVKKSFRSLIQRAIVFQVIICFIITIVPFGILGDTTNGYAGGSGSSTDPYLISNYEQLKYFADQVNNNASTSVYSGKYFQLTADIQINDTTNWENWNVSAPSNVWKPIGYYKDYSNRKSFAGTFDGNGYTISGLYVNNDANTYGAGLFGYLGGSSTATLKNLNITKSYIIGKGNVAAFSGFTDFSATYDSCVFDGKVLANGNFAGGIIGHYYGNSTTQLTIKRCVSSGEVKTTGVILGGIIGYTDSNSSTTNIINSYSTSKIVSNDKRMGGLVGRFDDGAKGKTLNITRCFFAGTLGDVANGTLVGEVGWSTLNVVDSYYNSSIIGGASTKKIQGLGKTNAEFSDSTVTNLLNSSAEKTADDQKWVQSNKHPVLQYDHCKLSNIVIDKCNFEFSPTVLTYNLSISNKIDTIKITPYATGYIKSIKIDDTEVKSMQESDGISLSEGNNTVIVTIVADDDSSCDYILNIERRYKTFQEGVWDGTVAEKFSGGSGSEDDPYLISEPSELALLAKQVNENSSATLYHKKYFKLTKDIYLNNVSDYQYWNYDVPDNTWEPIGYYKSYSDRKSFGGILNGNGYTIYGLYCDNNTAGGTGLFGYLGGGYGEIRNLKIAKSYISGKSNVGSFVGVMDYETYLTNCGFLGTVNSKENYTGGLVGHYIGANGKTAAIKSCYVEGSISTKGVIVGGLVGYTDGKNADFVIDNCYAAADISSSDFRTGGLVGRLDDGSNQRTLTIKRSYYYGNLGKSAKGTLVGQVGSSTLNIENVFYNSELIGGSADILKQGSEKNTNEFKNSDVCNILNSCILVDDNLPNWQQGEEYPVLALSSPKLDNIKLSDGNIEFKSELTEYKCSVPNKVQKINVTVLASGYINTVYVNKEAITIGKKTNDIALEEGNNTITVTSYSVDGDSLNYVITVERRKATYQKNVWDGKVANDFAGGTGTENDPYLISSANQLALLAKKVNECTTVTYAYKKYFKLTTDIYLNNITDSEFWETYTPDNVWEPIGYYNKYSDRKSFGGTLDGDGHTIYGLFVDKKDSIGGAGLFGYLGGGYGEIKDLTISNSCIRGKSNVASFAGYMDYDSKIVNSSFSGIISANENYAGGLVGHYIGATDKKLIINSCFTSGKITAKGVIVGGLLGFQDGKDSNCLITNCYSSMTVTGKDFKTAGFVGRLDDGSNNRTLTIEKSHFSGSLSKTAKNDLVGENVKSVLIIKDTFVNSDNLKANAGLVYAGTKKTDQEFKNGTIVNSLNASTSSIENCWEWFQGKDFPEEKRARLKSLKMSVGGINFSSSIYEYSMSVSNRAESIFVTPTAAKSSSKITVNGVQVNNNSSSNAINLVVGKKVDINIIVSDDDGSKSSYLIHVLRKQKTSGPSVWDGTIAYGFDYGTGTKDDPYIIATADQLAYLAYSVNSHTGSDWSTAYSSKDYFVLENDMIMNADYNNYQSWDKNKPKNEWIPIGTFPGYSSQATFAGNLDGCCHTIYGLYTNTKGSGGSGLFGAINGGYINNLFVKNSYISGEGVVGGIVGVAVTRTRTCIFQNVSFSGIVTTSGNYSGGIIGKAYTYSWAIIRVDSSYSEGKVTGNNHVGGIIGGITTSTDDHKTVITDQINNSYSGSTITGDNNVGGLIGSFSGDNPKVDVKLRRSHFAGTINCSNNLKGPIVGNQISDKASMTIANDVYYANDSITGSFTNQYDAVALTRKQFEDNTLLNLLNNATLSPNTDLWSWIEGDSYPVSPYASLALSNLVLSSGELVFDPSIFAYSVLVDKSVNSVTATAYSADERSTIVINGVVTKSGTPSNPVSVVDGETSKFEIEVTKPNGKKQTFSVNVVREKYMLYCVGGKGVKNGEFGQEIYVNSNETYTFSFKYYLKVANGLRPLIKYTKQGQNYMENVKPTLSKLDRNECELVYTFSIPSDAVSKDGKTLIKVGVKKDEESSGYISDFKLSKFNSNENILVNSDFSQNFYGWMDQRYSTYTKNNVFVGVRGEVELVPYIAKYFVKKPDDSNDKIFDDGDWSSIFQKGQIKTVNTNNKSKEKITSQNEEKSGKYLLWIIIPVSVLVVGSVLFVIFYKKKSIKKV